MDNALKERLKAELKPLYRNLMEHTMEYRESYSEALVAFAAQWGKDFPSAANDGILFVGRATNGWSNDDANVDNLFDGEGRIFNRPDQMVWVKEKEGDANWNSNHSAFWRVVRGVARNFYPDDELNHIAWSNLCKLAPDGGNPSAGLFKAQMLDACDILNKEVEILSPKFVVLMTGIDMADNFISGLNGNEWPENQVVAKEDWAGYSATVFQIGQHYVILTEHPQGKGDKEHIDCLTSLIKKFS